MSSVSLHYPPPCTNNRYSSVYLPRCAIGKESEKKKNGDHKLKHIEDGKGERKRGESYMKTEIKERLKDKHKDLKITMTGNYQFLIHPFNF